MEKSKVLIVDDDALTREMVADLLRSRGHEVVCCEAPLTLASVLMAERPNLVLMDVVMPALRGDRLIEIASRRGLHQCPMVFFSSLPAPELEELVRSSGAAGFIEKTTDVVSLVEEIESYLATEPPA